jgi:DNA-binding CsgD family transcriptional regulator
VGLDEAHAAHVGGQVVDHRGALGALEARLAPRQVEVFVLQILGATPEEIARQLNIVTPTVHKHIGAIRRKAGTRNYTELFARFFSPLRDD